MDIDGEHDNDEVMDYDAPEIGEGDEEMYEADVGVEAIVDEDMEGSIVDMASPKPPPASSLPFPLIAKTPPSSGSAPLVAPGASETVGQGQGEVANGESSHPLIPSDISDDTSKPQSISQKTDSHFQATPLDPSHHSLDDSAEGSTRTLQTMPEPAAKSPAVDPTSLDPQPVHEKSGGPAPVRETDEAEEEGQEVYEDDEEQDEADGDAEEHDEHGIGEEDVEDVPTIPDDSYPIDVRSLPPVILFLPGDARRTLFAPLANAQEAGPSKAPAVWLHGKAEELGEASLADVWTEIRAEMAKDGLIKNGEMVISEKQMELKMGEVSCYSLDRDHGSSCACQDDVNLQTITLLELLQLHHGCGLPNPVQLHVTFEPSRFFLRYTAIQKEVNAQAGQSDSGDADDEDGEEPEVAIPDEEVEADDRDDLGHEESGSREAGAVEDEAIAQGQQSTRQLRREEHRRDGEPIFLHLFVKPLMAS